MSTINSKLKETLEGITAEYFCKVTEPIAYLNLQTNFNECLRKFASTQFHSLPVVDDRMVFQGIVSLADLVLTVVLFVRSRSDTDIMDTLKELEVYFERITCYDLLFRTNVGVELSHRHSISYIEVKHTCNSWIVLNHLADPTGHCHRVVVTDGNRRIVNIISDTSMALWIYNNRIELGITEHVSNAHILKSVSGSAVSLDEIVTEKASLLSRKVSEVFPSKTVVTAYADECVIEVLEKMQREEVSSVFVVDSPTKTRVFRFNVSRSDICLLVGGHFNKDLLSSGVTVKQFYSDPQWELLFSPISEYITLLRRYQAKCKLPLLYIEPSEEVWTAFAKITACQYHNIYVCSKDQNPVGVVSLNELMEIIGKT